MQIVRRRRILDPNMSPAEANAMREARRVGRPSHSGLHLNRPDKYGNQRLPFAAVDGEGGGKDEHGRQRYLLLRAGDNLLFNDNVDLTTDDCLGFLAGLPAGFIYVAYYFDYDVTMILRHASWKQRERILRPIMFGVSGERRATYVGDYEVEYMPRKYFKVKHVNSKQWVQINEVGPFFQCAFVKAINDWETGTKEERSIIAENKARRTEFDQLSNVEIEYNELECKHLTELMDKFRDVCIETGYIPARWQGPGFLASDMMKRHSIPTRKEYGLDPELQSYANAAYYGGRFELFKIGSIASVYEYDINSAYPHAMRSLPCLMHGSWTYHKGQPDLRSLFVANVQFAHPKAVAVCHLPIRDKKTGSIFWPQYGNGWYWSVELQAALECGNLEIVQWRDHWTYESKCDCSPFDFVNDVYAIRKVIGKGTKGYALKLAINSLYGKTAQSIGSAPYANPVWAGLITAQTRAQLIRAYSHIDSRDLVMVATDGIYTTVPLNLPAGSELGQWDHKLHDEMFFIQPGIYFSSTAKQRPKTRGVPMAVVLEHEPQFREAFARWLDNGPDVTEFFARTGVFPEVELPMHVFVGMKLAQAWHKPLLAGRWSDTTKTISFDFSSKRDWGCWHETAVSTYPIEGNPRLTTAPYSRDIGAWRREAEIWAALQSDQPDLFPFTPQDQELTE